MNQPSRLLPLALLGALALGTGCEGYVINPNGLAPERVSQTPTTPERPGDPDPMTQEPLTPETPLTPLERRERKLETCRERTDFAPDRTPLRRLTRREYDRTIQQLLGTSATPASSFTADEKIASFYANSQAPVGEPMVLKYQEVAEALAKEAVEERLAALVPCDPADGDEACARDFLDDFATRAFRHPLKSETRDGLLGVYALGAETGGFEHGVELMLQAILQAPSFLYHVEIGDAQGRLDDHEIAARISYMITSQAPDAELRQAAADGLLQDPEVRAQHARRLLETEASEETIVNFFLQWIHLEDLQEDTKDGELFPEYTSEMRASMHRETQTFVEDVMLSGDGTFNTLLGADYTFVDERLAGLYGIPWDGQDPDAFMKVPLPAGERFGLLTHASLLSMHANSNQGSPVFRGLFVSEGLLCIEPPPTPVGIEVQAPDPDPNLTTRERFALHNSDPMCAGCHRFMDPIGHGFANYDAIGRYFDEESGKTIDASGVVHANSAEIEDASFDGVGELTNLLKEDPRVVSCMSKQVFRYAFGRLESKRSDSADACQLTALEDAWAKSDGNLREVLVALVSSPDFIYRAQD